MILSRNFYLFLVFGITICIVSSLETSIGNNKQEQLQCKKHCPLKQRWICGFNGTNYRFFGNKCWMEKFNCVKKSSDYNHVERKLCQKAHHEYHKSVVNGFHHKIDTSKSDNKCIKCNGGYKPICGYNGEINHMFKNMCHFKHYNCIHSEKKFQTTQLNNCPIPLITKNRDSKRVNKKEGEIEHNTKENPIK